MSSRFNRLQEKNGETGRSAFLQNIRSRFYKKPLTHSNLPALEDLLKISPDALVCTSATGVVSFWNPRAEKLFGWSSDEAVGRLLEDLIIPQEFRLLHQKGMKRLSSGGESRVSGKPLDLTGLHKSGEKFPIELTIKQFVSRGDSPFQDRSKDLTEDESISFLARAHSHEDIGWLKNCQLSEDFVRKDICRTYGFRGAMCFPIFIDNKVHFIVEFFSLKDIELSPGELSFFENIGKYISDAVALKELLSKVATSSPS